MRARAIILMLGALLPAALHGETLRLGWSAWSDAEVMSRLAKQLVEEHTEYEVELVLADIGIQYSGIARGYLDFMMMSWQPETHRDYLEKFQGRIDDLGVLYEGARLGWVVPAYTPVSSLRTIPDLANEEVESRLGWRIQGVDPGAGITRLSESALDAYGLDDYQLQYASGAGMAVALERAITRREWIVITAWRPHWIFGKHDLRFLDDPRGVLGANEEVHVIARQGFRTDFPVVAALLARMHLSMDRLERIMLEGERSGYPQAVEQFIRRNPDAIARWLGRRRDDASPN